MRVYDDITPALQAILRSWSNGDTICWVSFQVDREKLDGIRSKFAETYGTLLSAEKRRWRKNHGLPTAWACSLPILANPGKVEVILLASKEALEVTTGPFNRENWRRTPPEVSDFRMAKEPRARGDYAWTWRIQDRQAGLLDQHLVALVKQRDASSVSSTTHYWGRFYPMFGGIRRQLRHILNGSKRLWEISTESTWPGISPENLPMMVGYKKESKSIAAK